MAFAAGAARGGLRIRAEACDHEHDLRIPAVRLTACAVVFGFLWFWHWRSTSSPSWCAPALLAAFVIACVVLGRRSAELVARIVPGSPGIAWELLLGFFIANTLLFALTLASPLGIGWHLVLIGCMAATAWFSRLRTAATSNPTLQAEIGSLACIVFTGVAASLWVGDQQPVITMRNGLTVFTVWQDVFIHAREISAFAHAHGLASISDIKQAGVSAPAYHFASYMMPAALNALGDTSAIDAYVSFQLPFGLLLTGLAAYALVAVALGGTWAAVFASAIVVAAPDAYQQGFGVRYLSYQFMAQANLGMLYGIACIAIAWMFMIEGCKRERPGGVALAYALLAICIAYKAHLVVANALLLMLYPCLFFGRFLPRQRAGATAIVVVVFVAAAALSQWSPRVPTLRLDGSGIRPYVDILMGGFSEGRLRDGFRWLYYEHRFPTVIGAGLAGMLITLASFGFWAVAGPMMLWRARMLIEPRVLVFVTLVFVNYMAMSMLLALDERGIGAREEFVNRPQAWAYFVVVSIVAGVVGLFVLGRRDPLSTARRVALPIFACALLLGVHRNAQHLETFPEWKGFGDYAEFNAVPECHTRSMLYLRMHARPDDLIQDSRFDPKLIATAVAERQVYVAEAAFGGGREIMQARVRALAAILKVRAPVPLAEWARSNGVAWLVLQPEDVGGWPPSFLASAAHECGGFHVFRFDR